MLLTTGGFDRKGMLLVDELNDSDFGSTSDGNQLLEMRMMVIIRSIVMPRVSRLMRTRSAN